MGTSKISVEKVVTALRQVQEPELGRDLISLNMIRDIHINVGKTTLAVNMAVVLAQSGAAVGLMDADIYGPNVPTMIGVKHPPQQDNGKLIPVEAYGIRVMSIGLIVKPGQPLIQQDCSSP